MSHAVLFAHLPAKNMEPVAAAVAKIEHRPLFDVVGKLRRGWGFLEQNVSAEKAAELVTRLAEAGIEALSIPISELRSPKEAQRIYGCRLQNDAFIPKGEGSRDLGLSIPWEELLVVAAARFTQEIVTTGEAEIESSSSMGTDIAIGIGSFLVTGIPGRGLKKKAPEKNEREIRRTENIELAQLITTSGEAFFFKAESFNYEGLGTLKELNSSLNFQVLIRELLKRCQAQPNFGAHLLQNKKPLSTANYTSTRDFQTELNWMVSVLGAQSV